MPETTTRASEQALPGNDASAYTEHVYTEEREAFLVHAEGREPLAFVVLRRSYFGNEPTRRWSLFREDERGRQAFVTDAEDLDAARHAAILCMNREK